MQTMPKASATSRYEVARRKKNISRKVLAEKIGVNLTTIWRWEKGLVEPHPALRKIWLQTLGL